MNDLDSLVQSAQTEFAAAATPAELENAKARFLGKTGRVTELLKGMAALSVEEKKARGAEVNVVKQAIEAALTARRQALADAGLADSHQPDEDDGLGTAQGLRVGHGQAFDRIVGAAISLLIETRPYHR